MLTNANKRVFCARLKADERRPYPAVHRLQVLPELSVTCESTMSPTFRCTNLRAVSSGLPVNSSFWVQAQGKGKISLKCFETGCVGRETGFFVISLRNQMKPASVKERLNWILSKRFGKAIVLVGLQLMPLFQKDVGSYHCALLVTSGWHRFVSPKMMVAKSNLQKWPGYKLI